LSGVIRAARFLSQRLLRSTSAGSLERSQIRAYCAPTTGHTFSRPSSRDSISVANGEKTTKSCGMFRPAESFRPRGSCMRRPTRSPTRCQAASPAMPAKIRSYSGSGSARPPSSKNRKPHVRPRVAQINFTCLPELARAPLCPSPGPARSLRMSTRDSFALQPRRCLPALPGCCRLEPGSSDWSRSV
jgi:hypothetical protein